ncbi:MAG: hypothetical protein JWO99_598 [Candidatus Saccharibacteria bacterium]|nr:hypothetical protein [Candidatus Saccharibacteria bacterium]
MKNYFLTAKEYVADHKKQFVTWGSVVVGIAIIVVGLALFSYNTPKQPAVVYEPATACELLTLNEAKTFLGDKTINGVVTAPTQTGNVADSKCSYSDGKADTANAVVIALIVRSGINDQGIAANKDGFATGESATGIQTVSDLGDAAFYNPANGQLNVLKESTWIILSYGPGADSSNNSLDDTVKVAKKLFE